MRPRRPLLADVHGEVPAAGVTVVVGPSGAGKSTLLRLCNRLEAPTSGTVRFRDNDVVRLDPLRLRRRVGMVFQRPSPFAGTVGDNLRVAEPGLSDTAAAAALGRADLTPDFLDRPAHELSGGEAQRMCLARTLVTKPEVLLMDEPTSSVDPRSTRALEQLARGLALDGVPVLWVTHDLAQMRRLADRVLVLVNGRLVCAAAPETLERGAPAEVVRFLEEPTGADPDAR
jgi:putative ABC transport system ATP-binding protein